MLGLGASAAVAFALAVVGMSWLIRMLRAKGIGQPIHEAVTQHAAKAGTPTMGGLVLSLVVPLGYAAGLGVIGRAPSRGGVLLVVCIVAGGLVGAIDDWLKVRRGRNTLGLRERQKSLLLLLVAGLVIAFAAGESGACHAPSLARCGPGPDLGAGGWGIWVVVVVWLTVNSVNFSDGLEGLLAGSAVPPLTLLTVIAFWQFRHPEVYGSGGLDIALVLGAMAAACVGLLWWQAVPMRHRRGRRGLVPAERLGVVTHWLLVERRWRAAKGDLVGWPEPGRVLGEDLVAHGELAVDEAQLELGVGNDDAAVEGPLGAPTVQLQRRVPGLAGHLLADDVAGVVKGDVHVVVADVGLGRGREHRLR